MIYKLIIHCMIYIYIYIYLRPKKSMHCVSLIKTRLKIQGLFYVNSSLCVWSQERSSNSNPLEPVLSICRSFLQIVGFNAIKLFFLALPFKKCKKSQMLRNKPCETVNVVYWVRVAQLVTETMLLVQCLPNI